MPAHPQGSWAESPRCFQKTQVFSDYVSWWYEQGSAAEESRWLSVRPCTGDMVATNAFGMGIDKSNVRFITIHDSVPGSLEEYYQEAGRAGRDGLPSEAILLFKLRDVQTQHFFIDQSERDEQSKQRAYQKLQMMTQYANTQQCLQQFILDYFGEKEGKRAVVVVIALIPVTLRILLLLTPKRSCRVFYGWRTLWQESRFPSVDGL